MKASPFSRHKKELNASMNVVPYIDVMLVLLVIFMVTTPMLTTGVDVDLPKASTDNIATGAQMPVIISLKSNGEIYMSYENNIDSSVLEEALIETLLVYKQFARHEVQVMINADQNNQYGMVMQLMANLQKAGVKKVGLLTGQHLPTNIN